MLKSRKLKIIIGALVVIGVLIASSIWVSMSLKTNAVDEFGYTKLADNNSATSTKTQIDYIIENANAILEYLSPSETISASFVNIFKNTGMPAMHITVSTTACIQLRSIP